LLKIKNVEVIDAVGAANAPSARDRRKARANDTCQPFTVPTTT
jgi:hypothetical protein